MFKCSLSGLLKITPVLAGPLTTAESVLAGQETLLQSAMAMASACFFPTYVTKASDVSVNLRNTHPRTRSWSRSTCRLHFSQPSEASSASPSFSGSRDCVKLQIAKAQPEGTAEEVNSDVAERERESVAAVTVGVIAPEVSSDAVEAAIAAAANSAVGSSSCQFQVFSENFIKRMMEMLEEFFFWSTEFLSMCNWACVSYMNWWQA